MVFSRSKWSSYNVDLRFLVIIMFINCINVAVADIEPKPNYEDLTTSMAKSDDINKNLGNNMNEPKLNTDNVKSSLPINDLGFIHAFIASISVILVSELGDKTFFIAAIMAMRHPRITVFSGAISALALMTILSAVFGMAATIIPRVYTYYISTFLFAIFGLKMLKEGYYMKATDAQEELEEVQSDLRKREDELMKALKDGGPATSTLKSEQSSNRGSTMSLRIHRINEDYDSDDQTTSMLPMNSDKKSTTMGDLNNVGGSISGGGGGITGNSTGGRRTQSALNLSHNNESISNELNSNSIRYSNDANNKGTIGQPDIISKGDINANGMELKQIGSKKSLEKETSATSLQDPESGVIRRNKQRSAAYIASRIFMQAFTMTFLAEWGDRSQLTTIILSAREDVYGVIVGGVLGHSVCTGLAVIGGRMIAQRISVRTVTLVGGVVFILFAISALFFNPNEEST